MDKTKLEWWSTPLGDHGVYTKDNYALFVTRIDSARWHWRVVGVDEGFLNDLTAAQLAAEACYFAAKARHVRADV